MHSSSLSIESLCKTYITIINMFGNMIMQTNIKKYVFVLLLLLPLISCLAEEEKKGLLARLIGDTSSFSIPQTTHFHTVEMFTHASAVRVIACSLSIIGLIMIKQGLMTVVKQNDDAKRSNLYVLVPTLAGIIFTGAGICGILYDHKIINYLQ